MAESHTSTSRRTVIAALAAVPLAAVAERASAQTTYNPLRAPWDQAFAAYQRAEAEDGAFNPTYERIARQFDEAAQANPHRTFRPDLYSGRMEPVSTEDVLYVRSARRFVADVDAGRTRLEQIPSLQDHFQLQREVVAAANERDATLDSLSQRLGYSEAENHWETLGQARYDAEWALMETPAPDLPALLWKLEKLLAADLDGSTAAWAFHAVAQTMADARRLLSREG